MKLTRSARREQFERSLKVTDRFVKSYLTALNNPRALAVWLLYESGEHDQLTRLETNPDHFLHAGDFRDAYAAQQFLSKAEFLQTSFNTKAVALEKFWQAEEVCRATNLRIANHGMASKPSMIDWIITDSIGKISTCLKGYTAEELFDSCEHGPGVTQSVKGCDTSQARKFQCETGISRMLLDLIGEAHKAAYPTWNVNFSIQESNQVITVRKNAKTDRTIAVEPGINLWYQKGIGTMIRRRLFRAGLDLNERGKTRKRNQLAAQKASISRHLATVDFSAASDTIASRVVELLLPPRWFTLLKAARSSRGKLNGTEFAYAKFSSMGNGYTFELETLIFWALARATCAYLKVPEDEVSVFGDDVIIPVEAYELYTEICQYLGFTVNLSKSFSKGSFRESCGDHWNDGLNCKPYYLKEVLRAEKDVYKCANSVRRLAHRHSTFGCDNRFRRCWRFLRKLVAKPCLISEGYGDGGLIVNFDEATPSVARHGHEGFVVKHLTFRSSKAWHDSHGLLLARVRKGSVDRSYGNTIDLRDRGSFSRKRLRIAQWCDLGPWC